MMKRVLTAIMCLLLLTATAMPAWAQTPRRSRYEGGRSTQYERRYDNSRRSNYDRSYDGNHYRDRSVWDQSRDKLTVAGGAGAGALLGALAGGKKGAIVGAIIGGGGSALYTYKVRDRDQGRYYRRR